MPAGTMFDLLLLHIGAIEFAQGRLQEAEVFIGRLNERVLKRHDVPKQTAADLVWLHCLCLLNRSHFAGGSPPSAEGLQAAILDGERAVKLYGDAVPILWNTLARDYFYLRQIPKALALTERALDKGLVDFELATATLNKAVLLLMLDSYEESAAVFRSFLENPHINRFNWWDLMAFADHAAKCGHPQAIFMRALDRKLCRTELPRGMESQLVKWLSADQNRRHLQYIYRDTELPDLSGFSSQFPATPTIRTTPKGRKEKVKHKRRH